MNRYLLQSWLNEGGPSLDKPLIDILSIMKWFFFTLLFYKFFNEVPVTNFCIPRIFLIFKSLKLKQTHGQLRFIVTYLFLKDPHERQLVKPSA